jgi:hypothetical protein
MIVKGGKLGNDFKWSAIKNKIDYEQERDRNNNLRLPAEASAKEGGNVRSKSSIDQLRAGNEHARGNTANTQGGAVRYGKLPDSTQDVGLCIYRPSFTARIIRAAIAQTERASDGVVSTAFKIPKVLPLATLLDSYSGGNRLSPSNEPHMVDSDLKLKKRKKLRR